jgi:uncharacterized protein (DUF697 family)
MKSLINRYAIVAAVCGLIPVGGSIFILVLEGVMFYHICAKHNRHVLHEGILFVGAVAGLSILFKAAAEVLHTIPVIGQVANALVAYGVVYGLGVVIENYNKNTDKSPT